MFFGQIETPEDFPHHLLVSCVSLCRSFLGVSSTGAAYLDGPAFAIAELFFLKAKAKV